MKTAHSKNISSKLAEINFFQQYNLGKTKFNRAKLENINFETKLLRQLELIEANLDGANFKKTILIDSDLSKSSLIEAKIKAANLNRVNLSAANLSNASLSLTKLTEVNLTRACLWGVSFCSAQLNNVDLSFSNLCGAFFNNIDLSNAILKGAYYNDDTQLPCNFDPLDAGMIHESNIESIDSLITRFNSICTSSNRYLGNVITTKFLYSSRPNFDWLSQFEIDRANQITFNGKLPDLINPQQFYFLNIWINSFIQSCSQIIKNFNKFI